MFVFATRLVFFFFFFPSGEHKYLEKYSKFFGKLPTRCSAFPRQRPARTAAVRGALPASPLPPGTGTPPRPRPSRYFCVQSYGCERQKGPTCKTLRWPGRARPGRQRRSARSSGQRGRGVPSALPGQRSPGAAARSATRGAPEPPRCLRWTPDSHRKKYRKHKNTSSAAFFLFYMKGREKVVISFDNSPNAQKKTRQRIIQRRKRVKNQLRESAQGRKTLQILKTAGLQ